MAVPWLAILKTVPWSDVIGNAPAVADAAQKLWKVVSGNKSAEPERAAAPADRTPEPRIAALEAEIANLNNEMLASSKLLKDLADQNAWLIAQVEQNRVRIRRWMAVSAGAAAVAAASLAVVLGLDKNLFY